MKYAKGTSLSIFQKIDEKILKECSEAGISAIELAFPEQYYLDKLNFFENPQYCFELASKYGIKIWSIHLPYCSYGDIETRLDISSLDDFILNRTMGVYKSIIKASASIGIPVAVVHASMDPILEKRSTRIAIAKKSLIELARYANEHNIKLAVENLPRTCLANTASEMIDILSGIQNIYICFDTNHSLIDDNIKFLNELYRNSLEIVTLHLCDYDFIDERHILPGEGVNNWAAIFDILKTMNYKGPLMYEVRNQTKDYNVTLEQISKNQDWLIEKFIK